MAKNEFLPFGTAEGANVLSNQEYEALAARHNGFNSGVAKSKELNKVWRQASLIASAVAQFIVDTEQKDLLDTGDVADIKSRLASAINLIISNGDYVTNPYLKLELLKKIDKADIAQQLGNDPAKVASQQLVTTELGKKAGVADVNGKLAKDQNGADIPNKPKFIENLGLPEKFQPKGNYAVTDAAATQLFTGPVISSDTVGAQNADGKLKSFLFNSGGAAPAWGATVNGGYAGALKHPLKDGTAATTDDVKEAKGLALGVGQAWQIVTRGNGATNTNNTGRTITVNVIRYTGVRGRVSVNGISVAAFRGGRTDTSPAINVDMTVTAIVPPGAKYIISWDKDVADAGEPEIVELR